MASLSLTGFINERAVTGNPLLCNRLFRDRVCKAKSLYNRNLVGHFGCVNAIEFSNKGGQFLASGKLQIYTGCLTLNTEQIAKYLK